MFKDEVVPPKRAQLPQKLANGNYSEFSKYILILYNHKCYQKQKTWLSFQRYNHSYIFLSQIGVGIRAQRSDSLER
jgi:hypothetical protein